MINQKSILKKFGLYYRTIKYLKPIQFRYRLYYFLRNKFRKLTGHNYPLSISKEGYTLELITWIPQPSTFNLQPLTNEKTFTFLNQTHTFNGYIDWNFSKYGKLWAYNLNYFDYLHQDEMTKEEGLALIREFIQLIEDNREGLEPFPISLRGINWIKFINRHEIRDKNIDASLFAQYQILLDNLEYHLLGNHLLEDGCSLLFGAHYFRNQELYSKAKEILNKELDEQILSDGGHFERSTMYHCILLERLLDCYNVARCSDWLADEELHRTLRGKVGLMLGWLEEITIDREHKTDNGRSSSAIRQLPLLNDAAKGVGPAPQDLFEYAHRIGLKLSEVTLAESGYRRYDNENFNLVCDVGPVGPDHQPGHAHSDTFSFVLYTDGKPIIVDPGISTYENNDQRQLERSTAFHNTVQYEEKEQSEVWSAFRVGRRARVMIKSDGERELLAEHDGYQPWGVTHERRWLVQEDCIHIEDRLIGEGESLGVFYLHFHPDLLDKISVEDNDIKSDKIKIEFESADKIKNHSYDCPDGYNQYIKAPKIEVQFVNKLVTRIYN